jgi:transcriptional regulator with GAF, ATPase, and Fis domain
MSTPHFQTPPQRNWLQVFFQTFIAAHASVQSLPERRKAELAAALSLSFSFIVAAGLTATLQITGFNILVGVGFLFSAISFVSYLISRSPLYKRAPLFFVGGFALLAYTAAITGADPALFLTISFTVLFLLANLFDLKWMIWFVAVNLVVAMLVSVFFLPQTQGVGALNARAGLFTIGLFVLLFAWHRNSLERLRLEEVTHTQTELQQSNIELQNAQREVNVHFEELRLAAEVGRAVSQVRDLKSMLTDAVELIRTSFDLYYAQIYLVDQSQTYLILQAGTGQVGKELQSRNHRLPINTNSINGRAVVEKKSVVISNTTTSAAFKPNPLLPETHSEMAVPLMIGSKVVGALDMQSKQSGALNEAVLPAFEALSAQLAIAVQNASYLAEAEQARTEVEKQAQRLSQSNWAEYLDGIHQPEETGFVFEQNQVLPLTQGQTVKENALTAPITITGQPIGNLVVEMEGQSPIAKTEELISTIARQVAQQVENLRLLESAERYRYEAEQATRRLTHEGWEEYMENNAAKKLGYIYDLKEVRPPNQDEAQQAGKNALTLPLKIRDEAVGKLVVQDIEADNQETAGFVNQVAERLSSHIEGLRLAMQTEQALAETKKQAQREQALRQITSAVRGSTDPTIILRSAARELGNLLGRQTVVHLATDSKAQEDKSDLHMTSENADGDDK